MAFLSGIFGPIGRGIRKFVPNLSGLSKTAAENAITESGLTVGTETSTTTTNISLDLQVFGQNPAAGSQTGPGESVSLDYYTYVAPFFPPFFPPSFPFFPPSFGPPFFPPSFPFFPPSFPFFPPYFKPPGWKSVGVDTLIRTPDGLVAAGDLEYGDILISAEIEGFPYMWTEQSNQQALDWTSEDPQITYKESTIVGLQTRTAEWAIVINDDIFSDTHFVLVMRDGEAKFIEVLNVVETDLIYSYQTSSFEEITLLEFIESPHEVVCINVEPYDLFFTEHMLVHDSHAMQEIENIGYE